MTAWIDNFVKDNAVRKFLIKSPLFLVFLTLRIKELVSFGFGDFRITISSAKDFDYFEAKELINEATRMIG